MIWDGSSTTRDTQIPGWRSAALERCKTGNRRSAPRLLAAAFVAGLGLASAWPAAAGQIYGQITRNGRPIPAGTSLELTCGPNRRTVNTDRYGRYEVFSRVPGRCVLSFTYDGTRMSAYVSSVRRPSRHDFEITRSGGRYRLRQR